MLILKSKQITELKEKAGKAFLQAHVLKGGFELPKEIPPVVVPTAPCDRV
jgi:hypothetical protein